MLLCSCGGVILLKICNLELQFLKKQIFLKGKYSVYEITILSYFRIVLLSLSTPSYKMCNPPTKKKKKKEILGWREAESFRSQSDFPGVQHCYDICRSLASWLLLEQPGKTSWQPTLSSITLEESRQVSFKSPYMASCAECRKEKIWSP